MAGFKQLPVRGGSSSIPRINIMGALMENRGIGKDGGLPWPPLKKDFEYYVRMVTTPKQSGKLCLHIKGRRTFEDGVRREPRLPNSRTLVISRSLESCPERADYLARSYDEAVAMATSPPLCHDIDQIWIMGGSQIYQAALESPSTHRLYLTKIHLDLDYDTSFPEFHGFRLVRDPDVEEGTQEENGVKFQFEVYEKIKDS